MNMSAGEGERELRGKEKEGGSVKRHVFCGGTHPGPAGLADAKCLALVRPLHRQHDRTKYSPPAHIGRQAEGEMEEGGRERGGEVQE